MKLCRRFGYIAERIIAEIINAAFVGNIADFLNGDMLITAFLFFLGHFGKRILIAGHLHWCHIIALIVLFECRQCFPDSVLHRFGESAVLSCDNRLDQIRKNTFYKRKYIELQRPARNIVAITVGFTAAVLVERIRRVLTESVDQDNRRFGVIVGGVSRFCRV